MGTNNRIGVAVSLVTVLAAGEARAECPQTPECHLAQGKKQIDSEPAKAAASFLESYKLDERTDTLVLYAQALQKAKRYGRALETWQRIIVFREADIEAAKETIKRGGRKKAAARTALQHAQDQSEMAAAQIVELWGKVGKVRVKLDGESYAVWHDGIEVDASKDILVNAGKDELVFVGHSTNDKGGQRKLVVEVLPGQTKIVSPPKAREVVATEAREQPERAKQPQPDLRVKREPARSVVETTPRSYEEAPRSPTLSRIGLGVAAGGIVALGVAGTFAYLSAQSFDDAKALGCNDDGQCPVGEAVAKADQSNDRARVAQVAAIGGGAMLVSGAAMYLLGRGKTRRATETVTLRVDSSSVAIGWSLK